MFSSALSEFLNLHPCKTAGKCWDQVIFKRERN